MLFSFVMLIELVPTANCGSEVLACFDIDLIDLMVLSEAAKGLFFISFFNCVGTLPHQIRVSHTKLKMYDNY